MPNNVLFISNDKANSNFEKVNTNLTQIFGIGKWTAEMFSIFYLGLPNIMPLGDLGFINAYKKYYRDQNLTKLSSLSYLNGNANEDPACELKDLALNSKDLILLTGNYKDFFGKLYQSNKIKKFEEIINFLKNKNSINSI